MLKENLILQGEDADLRIDKVLSLRFPEYSRNYFQYLIENGFVKLNSCAIKKREKGEPGDILEILFQKSPEIDLVAENIPLDILYEDEYLIVVSKPPGLVVHPAPGHPSGTFVNALLYHLKNSPFDASDIRPGIVHRLDKDTSGLLIAAKNPQVHALLVEAFSNREIKKQYLAICLNVPKNALLDAPIGRDTRNRKKQCIREDGKSALTEIEVLASANPFSLVLAKPVTGRTHQVRIHLKSAGCPILGDALYGNASFNKKFHSIRQLLHAYKLSFLHPITQVPLDLVAPLPADFEQMVKNLFNISL